MITCRRLCCFLALSLALMTVQAFGLGPRGKTHAKASLLSSVAGVIPGQPFDVGLKFHIDPEWHIYWKNGGDAGLPPRVKWELPEGFSIAELRFPAPTRHIGAGDLSSNIHEGEPMLLAAVTPDGPPTAKEVTLTAKGKYLICNTTCIWEKIDASVTIAVLSGNGPPKPLHEKEFSAARRALPRTSSKYLTISVSLPPGPIQPNTKPDLIVTLEIARGYHIQSHEPLTEGLIKCDLFLEPAPGIYFDKPIYPKARIKKLPVIGRVSEYTGTVSIRVPAEADEEIPKGKIRFAGVVKFQACNDKGTCFPPEAVEWSYIAASRVALLKGEAAQPSPNSAPLPAAASDSAPSTRKAAGDESGTEPSASEHAEPQDASSEAGLETFLKKLGIPGLLVMCFLYGLFINATPCVLPLLSIKVMGFVQQAHESRSRTMALGLSFGAGVVIFFVVLGLLASAGKNVFQYPIAIIILCSVIMTLALSMLDVYTLQVPTTATKLDASIQREGVVSSFGKGALAPVLGFACTGPLLAGAFGWATQQPQYLAILAFLFAGLGMASPYMLLGANPNWLSFLPKPGNWMITFERIMGFLLLAMVVWFLDPLAAQIGADGLQWTYIFLVAVAMACWMIGRIDISMPTVQRWRFRGGAGALVLLSYGVIFGWMYPLGDAAAHQQAVRLAGQSASESWDQGVPWQTWSEEAVRAEVQAGRIVFVDFTASWCKACKINKRVATNTPEVRAKMKALGVAPFQADFTSENPTIAAALQKHGRAGPPLNLIYRPGKADTPIVLQPNLSKAYLLQKLDDAGSSALASAG